MQQVRRGWKCLQAAVWSSDTGERPSRGAFQLKILVFPSGGANKPHKHGIGHKASREGSQHTPSPITKYYIFSLFAVVRAAEYAPIAWHRAQGAFITYGATAERCIMVVCPLGRSRYRGPVGQKTSQRNKEPDLVQAAPSLGRPEPTDVWRNEEEREQTWHSKDFL